MTELTQRSRVQLPITLPTFKLERAGVGVPTGPALRAQEGCVAPLWRARRGPESLRAERIGPGEWCHGQVAKDVVEAMRCGNFHAYTGMDGVMLRFLTCGMSPSPVPFEALVEVGD